MNATEWGRRSQADPDGLSFLAADVAKLTLVVGQPVVAEVDTYAADLGATLAAWRITEPAIRERVDRLDWVLDGWEHVLAIWDGAVESPTWVQVEGAEELVCMRTVVPQKERGQAKDLESVG